MTVDSKLQNLLASGGEFSTIIEDLNVKYVIVAPNGEWTFSKLGRIREGGESLSAGWLEDLRSIVESGQVLRHREWAIRSFDGVGGPSFLVERLPSAVVDRLPQTVVNALKRQIRRDGNGLLVGQPGSSKGAIMLWLAMQIPDEHVLYVSENPPNELPGGHIVHVFPPNDSRERRNLERLARLNQTVIWDRVASPRDVHTLFGFPGARRRWFSLDASGVRSSLRTLAGYMYQGVDARFDTIVALESSVIGRPEVLNFLMRDESGRWEEVFHSAQPALELIKAFSAEGWDSLGGLTQRSEPEEFVTSENDSVVEEIEAPAGLGEESSMVGIRKRPGQMTQDFENPLTIPVDGVPEHISEVDEDESTRIRSSGEINLQDFVNQRASGELPEETRQYDDTESARTATADADLLREILPSHEEEPPEAVNLEDLRITRAEDISEETLEAITNASEESAERQAAAEMRDGDTSSVSYEQIPKDALQPQTDLQDDLGDLMDIDFQIDDALQDWDDDSYAEDEDYSDVYEDIELEEISGMISSADLDQTSVATSADMGQAMTQERDSPNPDTSPTMTAGADLAAAIAAAEKHHDGEDETTEMTVDRLMDIRRQLGDQD